MPSYKEQIPIIRLFWFSSKKVDSHAVRRGIALLFFFKQICRKFPLNCESVFLQILQMYGKVKTLIVAFLAKLFPSNAINEFFYLVSVVFEL